MLVKLRGKLGSRHARFSGGTAFASVGLDEARKLGRRCEARRTRRAVGFAGSAVTRLATVGSSVSIYLSAWWGSLESRRLSESSAVRSESIRASNVAAGQADVDVSIFTAIVAALAHGDQRLAHYLARRARDEFRPALQAWERLPRVREEGDELSSPPGTPFELPEYRLRRGKSPTAYANRLTKSSLRLIEPTRSAPRTSCRLSCSRRFFPGRYWLEAASLTWSSSPRHGERRLGRCRDHRGSHPLQCVAPHDRGLRRRRAQLGLPVSAGARNRTTRRPGLA